MRTRRFAVVVCLFFATFLCSQGQMRILPKEKIESVNNPRMSPDTAFLRFDRISIAADPMNEDDAPESFIYPFSNVGSDTLEIKRLVSTCSCATARFSRRTVAPGESGEIIVRYNPEGHPGRFERKVFVYTQEGNDPSAVLRLSVNVSSGADLSTEWPVQIGNIRLRRDSISFESGRKSVERMRFINLDVRSIDLECEEMFLPEGMTFRTEPQVVAPGKEGEIVISYTPSGDRMREEMKIILKNTGVPPSISSIKVTIKTVNK